MTFFILDDTRSSVMAYKKGQIERGYINGCVMMMILENNDDGTACYTYVLLRKRDEIKAR